MDKRAGFLDNTVSDIAGKVTQPIRDITLSPVGLAGGVGLLGAGAGILGWNALVNTTRSLGRLPARKLFHVSNQEWDDMMDDAISTKWYRWVVPSAAGLLAAGGVLAANYNPREEGNGLLSWYPHVKTASAMKKKAAMDKLANDLFMYSGYVPEIDFSKPISVPAARELFDNNPHLKDDPYVRNMGNAILNNAAINAGVDNPTLGQINDSAVDKFKNKFTLSGIADIGVKTVLANTAAELFTDVVGAVAPLAPDVRRNIIDGTTLATALISIIK